MTRILIPYGTTEGLTARISEYVADVIRGHGYEADAVDLKGRKIAQYVSMADHPLVAHHDGDPKPKRVKDGT